MYWLKEIICINKHESDIHLFVNEKYFQMLLTKSNYQILDRISLV